MRSQTNRALQVTNISIVCHIGFSRFTNKQSQTFTTSTFKADGGSMSINIYMNSEQTIGQKIENGAETELNIFDSIEFMM